MSSSSPNILPFPNQSPVEEDPIVITGVGLGTSLGSNREAVWEGIQTGRSGIRLTNEHDVVGDLRLPCGMVDWIEDRDPVQLKSIQITRHVAAEALNDAGLDWDKIDRTRFGCSISAQFGNIGYCYEPPESRDTEPQTPWYEELLPNAVNGVVANEFGLHGPRICHTTACASGLVSTIAGVRMLQSGQSDFALCGAADAITELILASFYRMGVLSTGPTIQTACRPFDETRGGFVMGEGASLMVLERRSQAIERGATIYAELAGWSTLCQAHHVTGLDGDVECLVELIRQMVRRAGWDYLGPQYINAHGTGTEQNDRSELQAISMALGDKADQTVISSNKAVMGHLINAAGAAELAITALAMRDGYAPPTMNLESPLSELDCLPKYGTQTNIDRSLKLSLAFGGHLVGIALRKTPFEQHSRTAQPLSPQARIRGTENTVPADQSARRAA